MRSALTRNPVTIKRLVYRWSSSSSNSVAISPTAASSLMDLQSSATIEGEESQIATIKLSPGQVLRAESGSMLYMTHGVEMQTSANNLSSAMKRFVTGQNLFVTDFTYSGDKQGVVALGTDFPSKILKFSLSDFPQQTLICQKGAYLASDASVEIDMAFTKNLSTGFFGGQGFVLQSLQGQGDVLIKAGGTVVRKDLKEGETIRVSSGSIVAFTSTIDYDIQMMPGFKNVMFGGEGLFVGTLKGPGTIWLQGLPPDRMISEIVRRIPSGMGFGIPIGLGGSSGGGDGADGATEGPDGGTNEGMVATTDAAVDADRQATMASSGMAGGDNVDSESPSALFGDAVAPDEGKDNVPPLSEENPWNQEEEPTFGATEEPSLEDGFGEESFSTEDAFEEDMFQEDSTFSSFDEVDADTTEAVQESARGIFSTLWDFFTRDD